MIINYYHNNHISCVYKNNKNIRFIIFMRIVLVLRTAGNSRGLKRDLTTLANDFLLRSLKKC